MQNPRVPPKRSRGGSKPDLHAAARAGDLSVVESICNSDPLAVNSRDKHSRTPLHLAAWAGKTEVVSNLIKNKADVGAAAMDDTAAIHFASQKGHLDVVRILLSSGVSVKAANRKGLTPLHYAVQGSHTELIKYLVRKGASINARTKSGLTSLDVASSEEVRSLLVECEQIVKRGEESAESKKIDDSVPTEQPIKEASDATELSGKAEMEDEDTREKRNVEEEETNEENSSSRAKKARVPLEHLVAEDDTLEGRED